MPACAARCRAVIVVRFRLVIQLIVAREVNRVALVFHAYIHFSLWFFLLCHGVSIFVAGAGFEPATYGL